MDESPGAVNIQRYVRSPSNRDRVARTEDSIIEKSRERSSRYCLVRCPTFERGFWSELRRSSNIRTCGLQDYGELDGVR
jgi:hypothetical protein